MSTDAEPRCACVFEFGALRCERPADHPGPHFAMWGGGCYWFNDAGRLVEGASAEDFA